MKNEKFDRMYNLIMESKATFANFEEEDRAEDWLIKNLNKYDIYQAYDTNEMFIFVYGKKLNLKNALTAFQDGFDPEITMKDIKKINTFDDMITDD